MEKPKIQAIPPNKSKHYYYKLSKVVYLLGGPNYWYEDFDMPAIVHKIHDNFSRLLDIFMCGFFLAQWTSYYTQHNLSEKQKGDQAFFCILEPVLYTFVPILSYYKKTIREVAYNLAVKSKERYNDAKVESHMLKQATIYCILISFLVSLSMLLLGVDGLVLMLTKGKSFTTIVVVWPDVDDYSQTAGVFRVVIYATSWVYAGRVISGAYFTIISTTVSLSHQYTILCNYFYSLEGIFEEQTLDHEKQEEKYVEGFKYGIQLHSNMLRCTRLTQEIFVIPFSLQIFVNVTSLIFQIAQMVNTERTMSNTVVTIVTSICLLVSTGCLWWNAGDITVEASNLSTAMFHSGWHHCRNKTSLRIRSMLVTAMWQSQRPVELHCLGVVTLAYRSYVTIVRTSYSMFSVLY